MTELVAPGTQLERALAYAEGIAAFPQDTMLADRSAALEGIGLTLEEGMRLEARAAQPTLETAWRGAAASRRARAAAERGALGLSQNPAGAYGERRIKRGKDAGRRHTWKVWRRPRTPHRADPPPPSRGVLTAP